ncbi:MAG: hypothetical protein FJ297_02360 [Planctomycetes bacterium]|nr:hypothetical protein [Planctomycetota bacterium]
MHGVELLEQALDVAKRLGLDVRREWLGTGGGVCEFRGRRRLFVDLSEPVLDQLAQVRDALRNEPELARVPMSVELRHLIGCRRAA